MASTLDDLVGAAVRTWANVARTWIEAANTILVGWLDVADVESGRTGFNEGSAVVPAQQSPTDLSPESFSNWDDDPLPKHALAVKPAGVEAGRSPHVIVGPAARGNGERHLYGHAVRLQRHLPARGSRRLRSR
jgi:hypothetical protein